MPAPSGLRDLSPWAAHTCLRVEGFIRELVPQGLEGRKLLLAVSGGLDSTALAVILKLIAPRLGASLQCAHLDHLLRAESGQDALFCEELCSGLGLPLCATARDVTALAATWKTGIEDAGRKARYAWLEEARQEAGASFVCLAHHLDDLAEDQLMRLIRGAGWPALGGMPALDTRRAVLRPFLMTPKADLRRLLTELGLAWREDASNLDPAYTRNRVRLHILPLLARENPDYLGHAAELWKQARLDENHWDEELLRVTPASIQTGNPFFSNDSLRACSQALRLRLYKHSIESLGPGQPLAAALHGLDEAWRNRATGKRFQFPGGKEALVERGGISFHSGPPGAPGPGVDT